MSTSAGTLQEQIQEIVNIAVRAPSTHNSQPWKFSIQGNELSVFVDETVTMPKSDPEGRYKYISLGYLLHHLFVVGEYYGVLDSFSITPEENRIAKVSFKDSPGKVNKQYEALFNAIQERQNLRGPFAPGADINLIEELLDGEVPEGGESVHVELVRENDGIQRIGELTAESMRRVYRDPEFRKEMSHWIKPNTSKEKTGIHGYSLNQKLIGSLILPHVIRMFNVGPKLAGLNYKAITSAKFGLIYATEEDSKKAWISVGMRASSVTLSLLAGGYNTSIFVASLEHADTKESLSELLSKKLQPQFVMVGGKITVEAPKTPRYTFLERKKEGV